MRDHLLRLGKFFLYVQGFMLITSIIVGVVSGLYLGLTDNPLRDQVIKEGVTRGWLDPVETELDPQ